MRRRATLILSAALMLPLAGCSSQDPPQISPQISPHWESVALPSGVVPTVLTPAGPDALVIGGRATRRPVPRLYVLHEGQQPTPLALHTTSYYAPLAIWRGIASDGNRVYALGGARGGAHGNVRWTVYQGSLAHGLSEDEQGFEIFGGPSAGGLVGIAMADARPVIAGSWASPGPGLDIATWELSPSGGHDWLRQQSGGTELASTPEEQLSVRAVSAWGTGLVLAGAATQLGGGKVTMHPAVWFSPTGAAPWRQVELPSSGVVKEAQSVVCGDDACLVAGQVDSHLQLWRVDPSGDADSAAQAVDGLPEITLPPLYSLSAPVLLDDGRMAVVVPDGDGSLVLIGDGDAWSQATGPSGTPVAAATLGDRLYVGSTTGEVGTLSMTDLGD